MSFYICSTEMFQWMNVSYEGKNRCLYTLRWDFWNLTSWIFFQIFLFNVKSWECWKGFLCLEQLKGKWLTHVISSHTTSPSEEAKFHSARIWHVASFAHLVLLENGVILRPNITKLGLLNGLNICIVWPQCIKSVVITPWQLLWFFVLLFLEITS